MTQNYINHMKLNRFFWPKTQVAWLSRLIWMWLSILIHYYHQIHTHTLSAFRNVPRRHMLRSVWELLCMNLHLLRICTTAMKCTNAPLILVSVSVSARLHIETRLILILLWDVPIHTPPNRLSKCASKYSQSPEEFEIKILFLNEPKTISPVFRCASYLMTLKHVQMLNICHPADTWQNCQCYNVEHSLYLN